MSSTALIFDFDGVIADSEPLYRESWNMALEPWGHSIPEEDYWLYWTSLGEGLDGEIKRHSLDHVDKELARNRQSEFYENICRQGLIPLFEGVSELFTRLLSADEPGRKPFTIASNTTSDRIRIILEGNRTPVPPVVGGEGLRKKPFPDIFLKAASVMGARPSRCLVFEDAHKGVAAARCGGFPAVFVENSQNRNLSHEGLCSINGISHLLRVLDDLKGDE